MKQLIAIVLVGMCAISDSIHARSEQNSGKLLLENDQLRAVEYVIQAGEKLSLQSKAPSLFFCVNPLVATLTFKGGHTVRANFKVDDPRWYENPITGVAN